MKRITEERAQQTLNKELKKEIENAKKYIKKKMLKKTNPDVLKDFIDYYKRAYLKKRSEKEDFEIEIAENVVTFGEKLYTRITGKKAGK